MKKGRALIILLLTIAYCGMLPYPTGKADAAAPAQTCSVTPIGKQNTARGADSRFVLNGDGTVSAGFEVKGATDCKQEVTLATWQAPDGVKGQPYELQKLYKHVGGTFGVGKHELTVTLPDCFLSG